jgi:hypothetical protein
VETDHGTAGKAIINQIAHNVATGASPHYRNRMSEKDVRLSASAMDKHGW